MISPYTINLDGSPSMNNNVLSIYKENTVSEIRADLDKNRAPLVAVCQNLSSDFNKASVIRANNAFLGQEVYIVGRHKYNRKGAVGTYLYEHVYHASEMKEVIDFLHAKEYTVYAVDNIEQYNPKNLWDVNFPKRAAFVYGEEQRGLSEDTIKMCDDMVYVQQYGSVRSLNVAQCAAVISYEYRRRFH